MNILIIEDEAPAVRRLKSLLDKIDDSIVILKDIDSVEDAIEWLNENKHPDLIFSDIQLADGLSFSIFESVQIKCPIIFTTAYDEYAIKAFELNSLDYLLKPYTQEQLEKALNKLHRNNISSDSDKLLKVIEQFKISQESSKTYKSRFLISKADSLIPIKADEVAYIFTEDKAVLLKTKTNQQFFINYTLDELEELLDPSIFFRLNRQFIINIDSITKINNYFNGKLKVNINPVFNDDIIVSRAKAPLLKSWMEQ